MHCRCILKCVHTGPGGDTTRIALRNVRIAVYKNNTHTETARMQHTIFQLNSHVCTGTDTDTGTAIDTLADIDTAIDTVAVAI